MSRRGDNTQSAGEFDFPDADPTEKRDRKLTQKALEYTVENKRRKAENLEKKLWLVIRAVEASDLKFCTSNMLRELMTATQEFELIVQELANLYSQDKHGVFEGEALLVSEKASLQYSLELIKLIKDAKKSDKSSEISSVKSRNSHRSGSSRASTSSSVMKMKAAAEAAAAKEQADYERLIAERENDMKQREAEEERRRQQARTQHERDVAIMSANKRVAVANARLKAIQESIVEGELGVSLKLPDMDITECQERTLAWVHSSSPISDNDMTSPKVTYTLEHDHTPRDNHKSQYTPQGGHTPSDGYTPRKGHASAEIPEKRVDHPNAQREVFPNQHTNGLEQSTPAPHTLSYSHPPRFTTPKEEFSRISLETFAASNQQLVATLAKQSLPKCHPDVFKGDVVMFHSWKRSFKAMVRDADIAPEQELNYLRSFTSGNPQELVDNYRKRQGDNPATTLGDLWTELERRFGNSAALTQALIERLCTAAGFGEKDNAKLQKLADLCADVACQMAHLPGLACLNYPIAIRPIVERLPAYLRSKWEKEIVDYAGNHNDAYPTFHEFSAMIQSQARKKNHPNVSAGVITANSNRVSRHREESKGRPLPEPEPELGRVLRTDTTPDSGRVPEKEATRPRSIKHCIYHNSAGHEITECKAFSEMTVGEREDWIFEERLCFRCLSPDHVASACKESIKCSICGSERHSDLLHLSREEKKERVAKDRETLVENPKNVNPKCTSVCKGSSGGLSCSKIVLVDIYWEDRPDDVHRVYAIMDDQSNASLITTNLADKLDAKGPEWRYYLSTCGGEKEVRYGRRVTGLVVRSVHGRTSRLPTLIECDGIPQDKGEIPTPEIAMQYPHLSSIADEIPPLDSQAEVQLLIGRDAPELLKVRAFKNGPKGAPWAQKLVLGWTISGQACLDLTDGPIHVRARRTCVVNGAFAGANTEAEFEIIRCPNKLELRESYDEHGEVTSTKEDVYRTTGSDNDVGLSIEDRRFIEIMENGIHKNAQGNWEMPLPFRSHNVFMPNNRSYAVKRLNGLLQTLKRKPQMEKDYVDFMAKVLDKGHAVPVPPEEISSREDPGQVWYLPHFGVYHPKKPDQIRVVFDSSAEYQGVSLNRELLTGPDFMNSLVGVLTRFRREDIGAMCDVEQMFHSFHVDPKHRNFLRFLWFKDNDPSQHIIEYRMTVHLFGNGPSPAVATYGLRRTVEDGEEFGPGVKEFVERNFYVDDGLVSKPTATETIKLVRDTQAALATANLRLHKVVSNSVTVMEAFPTEDLAKDIRSLDLRHDELPAQRSLGVFWDLERDVFTYKVSVPDRPFTRRGVLSLVNSIYDPLGLAAPVLLEGRLLLQELVAMGKKTTATAPLGWDDPLPEKLANRWQCWRNALPDLENVSVQRCYHPGEFGAVTRAEIHAFSDASQRAIGAAVYLRLFNIRDEVAVSLVFGQAKVAPINPVSIPRLELCGAVSAVQAVDKIAKELDMAISEVVFYTDSKVVLGYIRNESRRFHIYVANRVEIIRKSSTPDQWRYVESCNNPADLATRGLRAKDLTESDWLNGPEFLRNVTVDAPTLDANQVSLNADDPEVRKEVKSRTTSVKPRESGALREEVSKRFSSWLAFRRAIAVLIAKVRLFKQRNTADKASQHKPEQRLSPEVLTQATDVIIKAAQNEAFKEELDAIASVTPQNGDGREGVKERKRKLKKSHLYRLDPYVDDAGIMRVGGRLRRSNLSLKEKHPILLPKEHHVSKLLLSHYHEAVHHQGCQITHGALRNAGYWLVGGHAAVARLIGLCVTCRKLRGSMLEQQMADLPPDRTEVGPPFTNVGFDVFGPWTVQTRRTRGGVANAKRWGLVFTCLASRAIHIELLETMDASSFLCALRRFFAIQGPALHLRCDRGTNFVGAKTEIDEALAEMDKESVAKYLSEQSCEWLFNPPHASHYGGAWERQIGTIRRILDAMLLELGTRQLTHELLTTLMAEVAAIVNARPITALPSDIDETLPLTPAMLLTQKTRPLGPLPGNFTAQDVYAQRRWRQVQFLADQFWTRWRREYIQNLQVRTKWNRERRNLAVGDIVMMKDEQAHRNNWPLGRVVDAVKSADGRVRKATVLTFRDGQKKTYERPISALVLLVPSADVPVHKDN